MKICSARHSNHTCPRIVDTSAAVVTSLVLDQQTYRQTHMQTDPQTEPQRSA